MNSNYPKARLRSDAYQPQQAMVYIHISSEGHGKELKMTIEERPGEEPTTQQYFQQAICSKTLQALSQEVYSLLHYSTHTPEGKGIGQSLQQAGQQLYHLLFPGQVKKKLAEAHSPNLYLVLDESLIGIPWEILHNGLEFLGLKFNIGRRICTLQPVCKARARKDNRKIKMWILANPKDDLPNSYREGVYLQEKLEQWDGSLDVYLETSNIHSKTILRRISEFDIIHYAGHAVYNCQSPDLSGWHLKDGYLTAHHILQISGDESPFPSLIFSNACRSGQTSDWLKPGLAESMDYPALDLVNAFLRCGVRHYIGTFQDIPDPISAHLAFSFYDYMMQSCSVGESLRRVRLQLINQYGWDALTWANYVLYGDPTVCYLRPDGEEEHQIIADKQAPQIQMQVKDQDEPINKDEPINRGEPNDKSTSPAPPTSPPASLIPPPSDSPLPGPAKLTKKGLTSATLKTWMRPGLLILFGSIFLIFVLFLIIRFSTYTPPPDLTQSTDPAREKEWEERKWQIAREILERLEERFSENQAVGATNQTLPAQSTEHKPLSMCIISTSRSGKETSIDQQITDILIEELGAFWVSQPGFTLVEREQLNFVLKELELRVSNITEKKLEFILGKVLGAMGILFIRIYIEAPPLFPFFSRERKVYLRFVDTETTVVEAYSSASFKDDKDLKAVSQKLGEEIRLALIERYKL